MSTPDITESRKLLELIFTQFVSSKSGVVVVEGSSGEAGEIGIEHGRLIQASWDGQVGEEAFWTIFRKPGITYRFVDNHRRCCGARLIFEAVGFFTCSSGETVQDFACTMVAP
jgi:hypothetical protein